MRLTITRAVNGLSSLVIHFANSARRFDPEAFEVSPKIATKNRWTGGHDFVARILWTAAKQDASDFRSDKPANKTRTRSFFGQCLDQALNLGKSRFAFGVLLVQLLIDEPRPNPRLPRAVVFEHIEIVFVSAADSASCRDSPYRRNTRDCCSDADD